MAVPERTQRRINNLRERISSVEEALKVIEAEGEDHYFEDATIVAALLFFSLLTFAGSFLYIFHHSFAMKVEDIYDLLAYVLPSCAGIVGGFGIYFRRYPKWFFTISALLVVTGFVFYALHLHQRMELNGHPYVGAEASFVLAVGIGLFISSITLIIIDHVRRGCSWRKLPNNWYRARRSIYYILLPASAFMGYWYFRYSLIMAAGH